MIDSIVLGGVDFVGGLLLVYFGLLFICCVVCFVVCFAGFGLVLLIRCCELVYARYLAACGGVVLMLLVASGLLVVW